MWIGVDSHGPASAYIATDSRFSWGTAPPATWDRGRKTFSSARHPDIAGFWGDVLFPVVTLSQFFSSLDAGVVAEDGCSSDSRFKAVERALRLSLEATPISQRRPFTVVYVSRDSSNMTSQFSFRYLSWEVSSGWTRTEVSAPASSGVVHLGGSGARATAPHLQRWNLSSQGGTSRAVFSAFVDGLASADDKYSGGPPQLVGLYRIGNGRPLGVVVGKLRYLFGADVTADAIDTEIEWRNELFERVSPATRRRLPSAQRHPRPI